MPSRKGLAQAVAWLNSKIAEKDTMDAVNAELCLNVIMDLKKHRDAIGARFHQVMVSNDRKQQIIDRINAAESSHCKERTDELYSSAVATMKEYMAKYDLQSGLLKVDAELPKEWGDGVQ